jgi:hypothetical protein
MPELNRSHLLRCPEDCTTTRYTAGKLRIHLHKKHRIFFPDGRAKEHPDHGLPNPELIEKYQPTWDEFYAIRDDERRKELQLLADREKIQEREDSGELDWVGTAPLKNAVKSDRVKKNRNGKLTTTCSVCHKQTLEVTNRICRKCKKERTQTKRPEPGQRRTHKQGAGAQGRVPAGAEVVDLTLDSEDTASSTATPVHNSPTGNGTQHDPMVIDEPSAASPLALTEEDITLFTEALRATMRGRLTGTANASASVVTAEQEAEPASVGTLETEEVEPVPPIAQREEDLSWVLPYRILG